MVERQRRRANPHNSMVASAAVMMGRGARDTAHADKAKDWQTQAWDFYDTVGELRFGVGWLANGLSRVNLIAAVPPDVEGDEPRAITDDDPPALQLVRQFVADIAGSSSAQGQLMAQAAVHLSVAGLGYVLAEPSADVGPPVELGAPADPTVDTTTEPALPEPTWDWCMKSLEEVREEGGRIEVATGAGRWRPLSPDALLIKCWRHHARRSWEADAPTRAVLNVLGQISAMDDHINACAASRLTGAGMLIMPTEAEFVPLTRPDPNADVNEDDGIDDFVRTMIQIAAVAKADRSSPAANVPMTIRIPGELCDKPRWLTFWTEFSEHALTLRDAAVKRLALGMDLPPEVLTGMSDVNHWTAWQVEETAITLHIEPMAETVCQALTVGYLEPMMEAANLDTKAAMVWYDTTDLTTRPDRSEDTTAAYDRYQASGDALRRESGIDDGDRPDDAEIRRRILVDLALANPQFAPQLLTAAGILPAGLLPNMTPAPAPGTPPLPPPGPGEPSTGPPPADGPPDDVAPPEGQAAIAASGAVVEAVDALVYRALERAGGRLRSAAGRKLNGGAAGIDCPDVARLYEQLVPVTRYADLDKLMEGAWDRVPVVAVRLGMPADILALALDGYTRSLLVTGHRHDASRLADALGLDATV